MCSIKRCARLANNAVLINHCQKMSVGVPHQQDELHIVQTVLLVLCRLWVT
jgi:hypothetical protein